MPYTYPGQAFDHTLSALKGYSRDLALDTECKISTNVNLNSTNNPVVSGLCVHVSAFTQITDVYGGLMTHTTPVVEMGCGAGHGMPLFLWPGQNDPDVFNPGTIAGDPAYGTVSRPADFISVMPAAQSTDGVLYALVATGAYELETTEYDTAQTYLGGNPLRAVTSNTNINGGKLTNQGATSAAFTTAAFLTGDPTATAWDTVVGLVSRGTHTNANRRSLLAFWPHYIPGTR